MHVVSTFYHKSHFVVCPCPKHIYTVVYPRGGGGLSIMPCTSRSLHSVVCTIATVVYRCMYSRCRVSSSIFTLPTAITHEILVLELWGVSHADCQWNSRKAPQFQYFNQVSDCSAQYVQTGPEALKRPYTVCMYVVHICNTVMPWPC